jgi:hypothetical protein
LPERPGGCLAQKVADPSIAAGAAKQIVTLEWLGVMVLMLVFSPQTGTRHLYLLLPVILLGVLLLMTAEGLRQRCAAVLALAIGVIGIALPPGPPQPIDFRFVGGGMASVLAMYLIMLNLGLRRVLPAAVTKTNPNDAPVELPRAAA